MQNSKRALTLLRKIYLRVFNPADTYGFSSDGFDLIGQSASDLIKEKLLSDEAVMICRLGSGELDCALSYANMRKGFKKYPEYISGKINIPWWDANILGNCFYNSGVFPINYDMFCRFGELMV